MLEKNISIVIPAFNCEKTIAQNLTAILGQSLAEKILEIIVIDDGSTDGTFSVVESFKGVRCVRQKNAGPASARNRGAAESKGAIIFFTDSDCIPEKDWLEKSLLHFDDPKVAVVAGSYGIANEENLLARCIYREIIFRHNVRMPKFPKSFGSYNFGIRRNVFSEVGGFNERYRYASGEDNDLSYKILKKGYKICFEKESLVRHYFPTSLMRYLKEQYAHGFWRVRMYRDHPGMARGDDYTFWKDIIEPPVVLLFLLSAGLSLSGKILLLDVSKSLFIFLTLLEISYGILATKSILEGIFFGFVTLLRAFARTLGFSVGILRIFLQK
ncbi:MAG TPA: glycosyltransferase [Candidatus Omnitrophota bacterium]|nr:glycosyltransferase [Candidatus Omnitrophota bacterium]HPD85124.1 glycosyltransferase [Candidatus Omnitrophota bacterium]HRZ03982.1 glycosyltransferase [Candidatus Omnitrophota bacterium]